MIGTTVSHYNVLREIGSGGMGVVYEAEDIKLGRRVALKFLPREMAANPQALQRFQQEARTASALNHENICTIYEVDEHDGQPFIAMELLDGVSLADRMAARPFTLDALLDIGIQVADALDAAHRKGIVHRDIKPANIFITQRGRAKVLDFGLAKLAVANSDDATAAAVIGGATQDAPAHLTSPGSTVGTVAYMSPEQARGEELDARSDLFSFGAVLYQMATSRMAFAGATPAVVFHAILEKTPPSLTAANPELPVKLEEIVFKTLEKDVDLRYQTAAEIRGDLKRLKRDSSSGKVLAASSGSLSGATAAARQPSASAEIATASSSSAVLLAEARRHKTVLIGGVLLAVGLIAAVTLAVSMLLVRSKPTISTQKMTVTKVTDNGRVLNAAISPDGRYMAYEMRDANRSLRVKQLATGADVQVVPPQPGAFADRSSFTPDGNYLYYAHQEKDNPNVNDLFVVPSLGGTPRHVLTDMAGAVAFSPDGKQMAFTRSVPQKKEDELIVANSDGTSERVILTRESGSNGLTGDASWSGDGKLIAIGLNELGGGKFGSVLVVAPDGRVVNTFSYVFLMNTVAWMPDGSGIFFIAGAPESRFRPQIMFQPYPSGEVVRVTNDFNQYETLTLTADSKSLLTVQRQIFANVFAGDIPAQPGAALDAGLKQVTSDQANGTTLSWTVDGKLLTMDPGFRGYMMDADGSNRVPLLEHEPAVLAPTACGPADIAMVALLREKTTLNIYKLNLTSGERKRLTSGTNDQVLSCTPDGKVVYMDNSGGTQHLMKISSDGGTPVELASGQVSNAVVSPDGRQLAYGRIVGEGAQRKREFVVQSIEGGPPVHVLPPTPTMSLVGWWPDGQAVLVAQQTGLVLNLYRWPLAGGDPVQLTHFDSEPLLINAVAVSRDGKKIAITRQRYNTTDAVMLSNFH